MPSHLPTPAMNIRPYHPFISLMQSIMNMYFHLFRKNRGQTRCNLWFTEWEANTRNAVCHLLMYKPVELDWHFSRALPLGNWKGNSSDSSFSSPLTWQFLWTKNILRWSCMSLHLNGWSLGKIKEGFFTFTPYIFTRDSSEEMIWSCSLKKRWCKHSLWFSSLSCSLQCTWKDSESAKGHEAGVSNSYKEKSSSAFHPPPNYPTKKHLFSDLKEEIHNIECSLCHHVSLI